MVMMVWLLVAAGLAGLVALAGLVGLRVEVCRLRRELAVQRHAAEHDSLTGLLNRRGLQARAAGVLAGPGGQVAVVMLDLDGFKPVNDTYGHQVGDRVLVTVAARLVACLGDGWWCARLGGDELAALHMTRDPVPVAARAAVLAETLAEALAAPMHVAGQVVRVGAAVGAAVAVGPVTLPELLRRADAAMYRAKCLGRPVVWEPADGDHSPGRSVSRPLLRTRDLPVACPAERPAAAVGMRAPAGVR